MKGPRFDSGRDLNCCCNCMLDGCSRITSEQRPIAVFIDWYTQLHVVWPLIDWNIWYSDSLTICDPKSFITLTTGVTDAKNNAMCNSSLWEKASSFSVQSDLCQTYKIVKLFRDWLLLKRFHHFMLQSMGWNAKLRQALILTNLVNHHVWP